MIREAKYKDIDALMNLLGQVLLVHHNIRGDIFKAEGSKYSKEQLKALIDSPLNPIFVYVDNNDNVIGHIMCQIKERKETANAYAYTTLHIDDFCVDKNSRGRHIGTALYNYVRDYAYDKGFHNITLGVWEGNSKAKAFYDNLGMKPQQVVMEEMVPKKK